MDGELKTEPGDMSLEETAEEGNTEAGTEEDMEAEPEEELVEAKGVNERLKQMLNKVESGVDDGSGKSEVEKLNKFLDIVEKRLEIKTDVNSLVNKLEDLKMIQKVDKNNINPINVDDDVIIKVSRSMQDITDKVLVFEHHVDRQKVCCIVCKEDFVYEEEKTDFTKGSMGLKFSNLKLFLRRRSSRIKSYFISEAVDSIVKKTPAVPFMV